MPHTGVRGGAHAAKAEALRKVTMKRAVRWGIGVCSIAVALGLFLRDGHRQSLAIAEAAKKEQAAKKTEATPAAKAEEKIAFTFENDAKMEEFTKLWGQRQGMIVRMTVLQAYWNQEQAGLAQLNNKLAADYKLDATKNYSLDAKRRVLIEREAAPVSLPGANTASTNPPAATAKP